MQGDAALDRTGVVLSWQVQPAAVRTHSGLWCRRMMMQHQGECATTGDAATGAEVRPVRASGVAVMVARTTRDGDAAASCSETSSSVGEV